MARNWRHDPDFHWSWHVFFYLASWVAVCWLHTPMGKRYMASLEAKP